MAEPFIQRLCLIGVGLIGGSLARALREAGAVGEIVGCARHQESLDAALELGVIDRAEGDPAMAVRDADMVVLAVPVGESRAVLERIRDHLAKDAILTDVGSTKGSVVAAAREVFGQLPSRFVPAHPIAGTEQSGVGASFAELFRGRRVILTPDAHTDAEALATVRRMWEACGAQVVETSVAHHDAVLAATSHLPHMLAYVLVDSLARRDDREEVFAFAAGGFRDFTRIASSNPAMWHDICFANREELLRVTERFRDDLGRLAEAIRKGDGGYLRETFERAKQARDQWCETHGDDANACE